METTKTEMTEAEYNAIIEAARKAREEAVWNGKSQSLPVRRGENLPTRR